MATAHSPASHPVFSCRELDLASGLLQIDGPDFDYDSFPLVADQLVARIDAQVLERELNADLHVWLIDFEGCRLLLKGEHYSSALWLEGLSADDQETLVFLARLLG
ncbi:Aminopeptidase N [Photobacterium marinum]|uniref:Aminopeptidase N n=1 Tax=Photobacterium marinum TaxID=1056511 RepID=L8J3C9_9GAMM|nr:DUF3630 family protein [Photobacterium marinum]ELR63246.1 Aminopeptidase N [Photobacterium marinum]